MYFLKKLTINKKSRLSEDPRRERGICSALLLYILSTVITGFLVAASPGLVVGHPLLSSVQPLRPEPPHYVENFRDAHQAYLSTLSDICGRHWNSSSARAPVRAHSPAGAVWSVGTDPQRLIRRSGHRMDKQDKEVRTTQKNSPIKP